MKFTVLSHMRAHLIILLLLSGLVGINAYGQTAPTAVNDTIRMCEGTTVLIDVLANDTDPDAGEVLETDAIAGPTSALIDYDDDGLPEGQYWITVDPGFTGTDAIVYQVCGEDDLCDLGFIVIIVAGPEGCVWPGDANTDNKCNYLDLLPIGVFYGLTGPLRDDDDGSWEESFCDDWAAVPGVTIAPNPKFADLNGDGVITDADTSIIDINYDFVSGLYAPVEYIGGVDDPEISLGIFSDTIETGTPVTIPIYFGSADIPATDIYGLGFELNYDTALVDQNSVSVTFNESWLGTIGTDMLSMSRNDAIQGHIDVSVTRINQLSRNGSGYFGQVSFVMEDNIAGKMNGQYAETAVFCIESPYTIDETGTPIPVQVSCDSIVLVDNSNGVTNDPLSTTTVYPNPTDANCTIVIPQTEASAYCTIRDIAGKIVLQTNLTETATRISTQHLASGTYTIEIQNNNAFHVEQLIIQH